jgi:fatty-acyl-CoA synthase
MNIPLTPLRFQRRAATLYRKKVGVICGRERFTYGQFNDRVNRLSRALGSLGVAKGDRVALLSYNCHRLLEAYYGVVQTGAVLMPLNIRLSPQELSYILNDAEASLLFLDPDFIPLVETFRKDVTTVKAFVLLDDAEKPRWALPVTYDELLAEHTGEELDTSDIREDDLAELFYTSGTTGDPKGVMLSHRNLYLHALSVLASHHVTENDVQLHTIPLFHVNGWGTPQTLTCVGGTHVMLRRFDPKTVLELVEAERVTIFSLVPTMATALVNYPEVSRYDVSSVRLILIGGAASPPELIRAVEEKFPSARCYAGYGLSETSPVLTVSFLKHEHQGLTGEARYRRQAMTGYALPGVELRVVNEKGEDVKPDGQQIGEIIARSDGVMLGYWRRPEETAAVIRDGWFHTGDMATIDEDGYILIVDRKKDIIISGGENIASLEIEKVLAAHPAVYECAVIAVPDEKWGEVPKALVVLKPEMTATAEELIEFCKSRLASFKAPKSIDFYESLPKGGTGKILKRELREKYWKGYEKRVH